MNAIANRLLDAIQQPIVISESELRIEASLGIAMCPTDGQDADELMKNADVAMYHAKSELRGSFQFYSNKLNQAAAKLMALSTELKLALERDEFLLFYQPKVCAQSLQIVGAEALIRWEHPTRGFLPPGEFIGAAETLGLINSLGDWVLRSACAQMARWKAANISLVPISVNVVASQLQHQDMVGQIQALLLEHGLHGEDLELEITEGTLVSRAEESIQTLQNLRDLGIRVSIDDYGTGYSSMSYMKRLPVDTLKIDRSFIVDLVNDSTDRAIVKSTITLAKSLSMKVVAEGVESDDQLALIRQYGCEEVQGFYFSRPVPAEDFIALLAQGGFEHVLKETAVDT